MKKHIQILTIMFIVAAGNLSAARVIVKNNATHSLFVRLEGWRRAPLPITIFQEVRPGHSFGTSKVYLPRRIRFFKDKDALQPVMRDYEGRQFPYIMRWPKVVRPGKGGPQEIKRMIKRRKWQAQRTYRFTYCEDGEIQKVIQRPTG